MFWSILSQYHIDPRRKPPNSMKVFAWCVSLNGIITKSPKYWINMVLG